MRSIWKGTISFGLVNIPIALGVATQRSDPKFRMLDREHLQPVRQQLFSPARGEVIDREEIVKGYEVSREQYLPIDDEELESVAVERRRTIDLVAFVDQSEIDPVFYDRTYYIEPQENAQKPYALLLQAMKETNRAALAKIVLSAKEHLALLRPAGDVLALELLFFPEDVRTADEIADRIRDVEVREAELGMARQLVESLTRPFDPEEFENEHKKAVLELVERKLAGEQVPVAAEAPEPAPVPDLMAALKASLDQAKSEARTGTGGGRRRTAAAGGEGARAAKNGGRSRAKAPAKKAPAGAKAKR